MHKPQVDGAVSDSFADKTYNLRNSQIIDIVSGDELESNSLVVFKIFLSL